MGDNIRSPDRPPGRPGRRIIPLCLPIQPPVAFQPGRRGRRHFRQGGAGRNQWFGNLYLRPSREKRLRGAAGRRAHLCHGKRDFRVSQPRSTFLYTTPPAGWWPRPRPPGLPHSDSQENVMARIEFDQIAHSYYPNPQRTIGLRPQGDQYPVGGRRGLCPAGTFGLRQNHPAQRDLRAAANPAMGRVLYDGNDVTALPPEKRNIAQVFQFPVLYDTMTFSTTWPFR
jgi:hypothetical protein